MKSIPTNIMPNNQAGKYFRQQLLCQVIESSRRQRLCQFKLASRRQDSCQFKPEVRQKGCQVLRQDSCQGKKAGGKNHAKPEGKNHTTCFDRFRGVEPSKAPNVIPNNIEAFLGAAKKITKKFYNIFRAHFLAR